MRLLQIGIKFLSIYRVRHGMRDIIAEVLYKLKVLALSSIKLLPLYHFVTYLIIRRHLDTFYMRLLRIWW